MIDENSFPISIVSDGVHTVECHRLSRLHVAWIYRCLVFGDIAGVADTPRAALNAAKQYNKTVQSFYA